jgi:hypothetical protein
MPPVEAEELRTRWGFLMYHVPAVDVPSGFDLAHARAVVFPGDEVVLIMADEQNDWAYETVLDSAAELILADSFGKRTRQKQVTQNKGQEGGDLSALCGTAGSESGVPEIVQVLLDGPGAGSQSMKQYILDEINIFNIGEGRLSQNTRFANDSGRMWRCRAKLLMYQQNDGHIETHGCCKKLGSICGRYALTRPGGI